MNTERLTPKQRAYRAYYAQNAQRIKAKKREQYREKPKVIKAQKEPIAEPVALTIKPLNRRKCSEEQITMMRYRRMIENRKIAKECGVDWQDILYEGDIP